MEAGLFSLQDVMHRSISAVVPASMGRAMSGGEALSVQVKPMPTDGGGGLSLARAKSKLSLVTVLCHVISHQRHAQLGNPCPRRTHTTAAVAAFCSALAG